MNSRGNKYEIFFVYCNDLSRNIEYVLCHFYFSKIMLLPFETVFVVLELVLSEDLSLSQFSPVLKTSQ